MIPQNTTIITKEMTKQLDAEQTMILKELERYDSWLNIIQFHFISTIGKLKLLAKKNSITIFFLQKLSHFY
jgi:hypothetical protein